MVWVCKLRCENGEECISFWRIWGTNGREVCTILGRGRKRRKFGNVKKMFDLRCIFFEKKMKYR